MSRDSRDSLTLRQTFNDLSASLATISFHQIVTFPSGDNKTVFFCLHKNFVDVQKKASFRLWRSVNEEAKVTLVLCVLSILFSQLTVIQTKLFL